MRYSNTIGACAILLQIAVGLGMNVLGAERELIEGDVFSHFRPTKLWETAGDVAAVDGEKKLTLIEKEGSRVLFNGLVQQSAPYLYTVDEFEDVAVFLEFMVPKQSNAGVYLFGRYEIQILDSYGVDKAGFGDLGGVYQRWRSTEEVKASGLPHGYEGVAPKVNAAKAPGEWQTMEIVFRAPRFDAAGTKTEDAKFVSVHVNGTLVQANAEVTGPTRAAPLRGDAARGPVVIQGDHGPIAIRSFKVKPLEL